MGINMETAINYMYSLKNRGIRYSMTGSRTGSDGTGDCSGTIYQGLRNGGASNAGWVLNTDSMHSWLEKNGFQNIATNKSWTAKRGDIVIFGKKGASGGAAGHIVIFISNTQIIHCTWKSSTRNGVYVDNEASTCPYSMGWYVYRLKNQSKPKPQPSKKSNNTIVNEVIAGKWGSGTDRTAKLKKAGYDASAIQKLVNQKLNVKTPKPAPAKSTNWIKEKASFTPNTTINVRDKASTSGKVVATYHKGEKVYYDMFKHDGGYVWISYVSSSGKRRYMATGNSKNGKRTSSWGTFK
ncbi:MAG TPA: hypothetical protein DIW15_00325 [Bavariicoccus seileri]|uniref:Uncharacterized protein n=1 Tax=Bavariicoccus seileri TaxID=549685 RepID=A0A3D4S313_9ENTE|nr:peptidoglycan amidohydrolase family protein [Bavariicoccus seileri]HCS93140.1 hypothetical protein [Bavariicoccus seileri]